MKVEEGIEVDAPVETTFATFSDFEHGAELLADVELIQMVSGGPTGVGTRWRETRRSFRRSQTEEMWVTEFEPPHHFVVEADSRGTHYRSRYGFKPLSPQVTHVTLEFEAEPVSAAAKCAAPIAFLFKRSSAKAFRKDLEQLKDQASSR